MVVVEQSVHPLGLSIAQQGKVYTFRQPAPGKKRGLSFEKIALKVKNLKGKKPTWKTCSNVYKKITSKKGYVAYKYKNCRQNNAKLTPDLIKWMITRLLALRKKYVCTSTTLQRELAQKKKVKVEVSTIRKALIKKGYKWLRRSKKPKYTKLVMDQRWAFAKKVLRMSEAELKAGLHLSLDGVLFVRAPSGDVARENFCKAEETHGWRKRDEGALPELQGYDAYTRQAPLNRILPLWGGVGPDGFAPVLWHNERKTDTDEWVAAIKNGGIIGALRSVNTGKRRGPWIVLCDGEKFLHTAGSQAVYDRLYVILWQIPPKSPDLNPVEKFWAWVRKQLRAHDIEYPSKRHRLPISCYCMWGGGIVFRTDLIVWECGV